MSSLVKNLIKFDKNQEEYIFHPRNILFQKGKKMQSSQSAQNIFNFKENQFNSIFDSSLDKEAQKLEPSENTFYNKKLVPPIYFYRKVQNPYKYNISSIPEYLIKTNEEKRFVDKLYNSINNTKEKELLENLINQKKLTTRKDYYKPKNLDIHNILRYEPNLYPNSFSPENKTNLINSKPQNMKLFEKKENKANDKYKIDYLNTSPNLSNNNSLKKEKKNLEMKIEIPND